MSLRACNALYCANNLKNLLDVYANFEWPLTRPVVANDGHGPCYIIGPVISFGILIEAPGENRVKTENIKSDDLLMGAGNNLKWKALPVQFSQQMPGIQLFKYAVLVILNNKALPVMASHVFMLKNRKFITADRLNKHDELIDSNGTAVPIKSIHVGQYAARFVHISMSSANGSANVENISQNHLINANGVVSGDCLLPFFALDQSFREHFVNDYDERPVVGSYQYTKAFGDECLHAPSGDTDFVNVVDRMPDVIHDNAFLPAEDARIEPPRGAHCLIPHHEAVLRMNDKTRPFSDVVEMEDAERLVDWFRLNVSGIEFILDWYGKTVNACAWIKDGKRTVLINAPLVLQTSLEEQGLTLAIAHEVAHHKGGKPVFPKDGLSCEGQSDFAAIRKILKNLIGTSRPGFIDDAIKQMARFHKVENLPQPPTGQISNCKHPTPECRIATYHAALGVGSIPACAL